MSEAKRDGNNIPTMLGVSNIDFITPTPIRVNPATGAIIANAATLPSQVGNAGKFLETNGSSLSWQTAGGGTPGGSDTQVQFNDATAFGGDANFTWDKTNKILGLGVGAEILGGGSLTVQSGGNAQSLFLTAADASAGFTQGGQFILSAGSALSNQSGGSFTANAGQGANGGQGGAMNFNAGTGGSNGQGGNCNFTAGDNGGTDGNGGSVNFNGGYAAGSGNTGGGISLNAGGGFGAGDVNGGNITLVPGPKHNSGTSGEILLEDPDSGLNARLDLSKLASSDKTFSFPNITGTFVVSTPDAVAPVNTSFSAGSATSGNTDGASIDIFSGSGNGSGNGGTLSLESGNPGLTGNGGPIRLTAASAQQTGDGGSMELDAGDGGYLTAGNGGSITFFAGSGSASGNGGDILFNPGNGASGGVGGKIKFRHPGGAITTLNIGSVIADQAFTFPNQTGIFMVPFTDRSTAQVAAKTLASYTVGAADGSFLVSANVLVTTATLHSFTATGTYTDEGNTSRTVTLNFSTLAGALTPTIANAGGAVPYEGVPLHIRAKAATTITIATTGTFTTVTYNIEGSITQIA